VIRLQELELVFGQTHRQRTDGRMDRQTWRWFFKFFCEFELSFSFSFETTSSVTNNLKSSVAPLNFIFRSDVVWKSLSIWIWYSHFDRAIQKSFYRNSLHYKQLLVYFTKAVLYIYNFLKIIYITISTLTSVRHSFTHPMSHVPLQRYFMLLAPEAQRSNVNNKSCYICFSGEKNAYWVNPWPPGHGGTRGGSSIVATGVLSSNYIFLANCVKSTLYYCNKLHCIIW